MIPSQKGRPLLTPSHLLNGASGSVRHSTGHSEFSAPPSGPSTGVSRQYPAHRGLPPSPRPQGDLVHRDWVHRDWVHLDLVHLDLVHLDLVHRDLVHLEAARSPLGLPLLALLLGRGGWVRVRDRVGSGLG
jgi:hypothetical protein